VGTPIGAGPFEIARVDSPVEPARPQRRLIPPPGAPGARRRLARSSLLAGIKAMADTWTGRESRA
jgi:hypothetical protein